MSDRLLEAPTIWELVRRRAEISGDATMLLDTAGRRVSWTEFGALAERTAAGLQQQGIRPGSTVTWQLPTRIDSVVVSMALARLGAVQNPVLHLYREREVGAGLPQSKPDFFLVPGVGKDRDSGALPKPLAAALPQPLAIIELTEELPSG